MASIRVSLKNILNIRQIYTLYCFDFAPNYSTKGESHDFWELVYVDNGEVGLFGGEQLHHVTAGQMILHKPNEFHRVVCDGQHAARVFIITFECHSAAMKFFYDKVFSVPSELKGLMKLFVEECSESFHMSKIPLKPKEHSPIGGQQLIHNYLECILIRMMRAGGADSDHRAHLYPSRESLEHHLVRDIDEYLLSHLDSRICLGELSEELHFGVSTLCNIYKNVTGKTIMNSFLNLKIDKAKQMLREEQTSISSISESLGFDTPQYFSRMFHRYTGTSPRDFRNSVLSVGIPTLYKA